MADEDARVDTQTEQQSAPTGIPSTSTDNGNAVTAAPSKPLAAASASNGSFLTRLFQSTGLRRPSKIPRLHQQQSSVSVASTVDHATTESSAVSKLSTSSAASVASSSRETTPFSSPSKAPASRLREPTKLRSRKRPRDELLEAVVDRLEQQEQPYSQELSSQTTHDDAASLSSFRGEEDERETKEDEDQRREQELEVARALQQDLLRDRARLRLTISSLKDDVEVYYELLARMEHVTMVAKSRSVEVDESGKREQLVRLADRIQAIISEQAVATLAARGDHEVVETQGIDAPGESKHDRDEEEEEH